jgi:hypothetical protein
MMKINKSLLTKIVALYFGALNAITILLSIASLLWPTYMTFYFPVKLIFYIWGASHLILALECRRYVSVLKEKSPRTAEIFGTILGGFALVFNLVFWLVTILRLLPAQGQGLLSTLASLADRSDQILLLAVLASSFAALYWHSSSQETTVLKTPKLTRLEIGTVFISTAIFAVAAIIGLGNFITVDEPKWLYVRVPQLVDSIATSTWLSTLINDKPGVLPAFLSAALVDNQNYVSLSANEASGYLLLWRLPIVIFTILALLYAYWLLRKLFDEKSALLAYCLIAASPFLMTISRIVNPDSTLWSTSLIALLCFAVFLKTQSNRYLYLSAFFQALALLSKFTASINFLLFFLLAALTAIANNDSKHTSEALKKNMYAFVANVLVSIFVYAVSLPYTWIDIAQIPTGTIAVRFIQVAYPALFLAFSAIALDISLNKARFLSFAWKQNLFLWGTRFINLVILAAMAIAAFNYLTNYSLINIPQFEVSFSLVKTNVLLGIAITNFTYLLLGLPLVMLLPFIGYQIYSLRRNTLESFVGKLSAGINILFTAYSLATGFDNTIANIRYQIIFLPFLGLLGGWIWQKAIVRFIPPRYQLIAFLCLIVACFAPLVSSKYPWTFTNILNYKGLAVQQSWGFGGYDVAEYLNSLPDAENIQIWTDVEGVEEFFVGQTNWRARSNPFDPELDVDYLVLTPAGQRILLEALNSGSDEFVFYHYKVLASDTTLLQYYAKTPVFKYCADQSTSNCYSVVEFKNERRNKD